MSAGSSPKPTGRASWGVPRARLLAAVVVVAAVLAAGAYWLLAGKPAPPEIEFAEVDSEVKSVIEGARAEVLRQPRSGRAWGHLGMVLRAHDFGPESSVCFVEAERLEPRQPRWPYLHGLTLMQYDLEAGIVRVARAVELVGDGPTAPQLRLAGALVAAGRPDEAERHFLAVLAREPNNPRAAVGLARQAMRRGELRESLGPLRSAAASPFARKAASQCLAEVCSRLDDREGLAALGDVTALPDDQLWPDPFVEQVESLRVGEAVDLARAFGLFEQGRGSEAVAALEALARRRPDSERAWVTLGDTHLRLGQHAAAEKALRRAVRVAPESVEGWFLLGAALALQSSDAEATEAFRTAIRLKPDHALAHYNLGQCLEREGKRAEATDAYHTTLRLLPGHEAARKRLGALTAPNNCGG